MPAQIVSLVENNFTKGLITEATGLNFPENAATSTSNCTYTLFGDVIRRKGIDLEINGSYSLTANHFLAAMSTYVWNNPGGDGNSKLLVKQVSNILYFYNIATSTTASPLSTQILAGTINLDSFVAELGVFDQTQECQYADGNGYLFVYHTSCNPIYVTYNPSNQTFTGNGININIRDFNGIPEPNVPISARPAVLDPEHTYNLLNQGWVSNPGWSSNSTTGYSPGTLGLFTFTVGTGLPVTTGDSVNIVYTGAATRISRGSVFVTLQPGVTVASGVISSYASATGALVVNITNNYDYSGTSLSSWSIYPINAGKLNTFFSAASAYPSNADVWWTFKDSTGTFNPSTTLSNVSTSAGQAPRGHFVINAFDQKQSGVSGQAVSNIFTATRPTTGAWYAGRVWYAGVNAFQAPINDAPYYTWTEIIYFSQISLNDTSVFGNCFQLNDPTSEDLNQLLSSDGGSITIPGTGTIHKLWPTQNGLLVFANNGIWFITGSRGIGFAADDYTVTKISAVKVLSNKSFVDVLGLPFFWNEEGIYQVSVEQTGSLSVNPLTIGTIRSFYNTIPLASRKYAQGAYDPVNYVIQWTYRSTQEPNVTDRYNYDSILNYNTFNKAFFPYSLTTSVLGQYINGINYVSYPFINTVTPSPGFKYHTSYPYSGSYVHSFADEHDTTYNDWNSGGAVNYTSSFTTGYKFDTRKWETFFRGQAWRKFQPMYVYMFLKNTGYQAYSVQGLWDYASDFNSNKWSLPQFVEVNDNHSNVFFRRHKIRGRGNVLQLQVNSVDGKPFDIIGWSLVDTTNPGV